MNTKANLLKYIELKKIKKSSFYKKTGLSNGFLDKNDNVSSDKIKIIISIYKDLDLEWLITGEGEMLKDDKPIITINHEGKGTPIYDIDVSCGVDNLSLTDERIEGYIDLPYIKNDSHIITARGDSMEPMVNNGDKIVLRKVSKENVFFGQIYVVVTEDYRLLKYVHKHPNDDAKIILRSANKHYDDMDIFKVDILEMLVVENILSIKTMM